MSYCFLCFPNFKRKALTVSYDDGVTADERLVEIFNKYQIKGTFNLNSGLFSQAELGRIDLERALSLYLPNGHEVAAHGFKHLRLTDLGAAAAADEILTDVKNLETVFGVPIIGMAYAWGDYDGSAVEILKCSGIKYARTTHPTESFLLPKDWLRLEPTCHHTNPKLMELARRFVEEPAPSYPWGAPWLFYLWGHSYEFDDNKNWGLLEEFCRYVSERNDVWYATNGEIYRYVQAYDRLEFSACGNFVYNPSAQDVYIEYFGRKYCVRAGGMQVLDQPR